MQSDTSTSSNQMRRGPTSSGSSTTRPGHFGLGDRAERLLSKEGLQSAILLPHVAAVNGDDRVSLPFYFLIALTVTGLPAHAAFCTCYLKFRSI